tara:strand:- start:491 stop:931 length:441 start_codon:yes stop_codon:yes gene_type:complete
MNDETKVINNKYSFIPFGEFGQLIKAIETQDNDVIVPIPCEIIKAGGTIIDKGFNVLRLNFRISTKSKRPINKNICLEFIAGSSFLEIYTRTPLHIRISKKFKVTEIIKLRFCIELVTNSYEVIREMNIQVNKIKNLSILLTLVNL